MVRSLDDIRVKDEYLAAALRGEKPLLMDGAMGTMLQAAGVVKGGELADLLCLSNPEAITAVHAAYVEAGAQLVITNTFNANAVHLGDAATVEEVYAAAADCVRAADARYVGGDIGPSGDMLAPLGTLTEEAALELFGRQAAAAEVAGCDCITIETFTDVNEAALAVRAARQRTSLPVFASMAYNSGAFTMFGNTPQQEAEVLVAAGAHVIGANCSQGPAQMAEVVSGLLKASTVPVSIKPNAGMPHMEGDKVVYDIGIDEFATCMEDFVGQGLRIAGGCCGTNPSYIERLGQLLS